MSVTLTDSELEPVARVFEALGNRTRLRILLTVQQSRKPLHIKAVAKNLKTDYAATYRHVKALEKAGLVEIFEVGRSRVLAVKNPGWLSEIISKVKEIKTIR